MHKLLGVKITMESVWISNVRKLLAGVKASPLSDVYKALRLS